MSLPKILVYSEFQSPRLDYTLEIIFNLLLKIPYEHTASREKFSSSTLPKINYSNQYVSGAINIPDAGFLSQDRLEKFKPSVITENELPMLFHVSAEQQNFDFPFDIFSAVFYLLTCYEKYFSEEKDEHGRIRTKDTLAYKYNFLERPLVNEYAELLRKKILERQPPLSSFSKGEFNWEITFDIDRPYEFLHKGFFRTIGGFAKDTLTFKVRKFSARFLTVLLGRKDTFDNHDYVLEQLRKYNLKGIWFILTGRKYPNDSKFDYEKPALKNLLNKISSDGHKPGLHFSYHSFNHPQEISEEKKYLEKITGKKISLNRQHFLRLKFPDTYERLIENEITDDYTLGFSDAVGFRAGICNPFPWFNLKENKKTNLIIHPLAVMDTTLNYRCNFTPEQASEKIKSLIDTVKKYNGTFSILWHPENLGEYEEWKGWRKVFEENLRYLSSDAS